MYWRYRAQNDGRGPPPGHARIGVSSSERLRPDTVHAVQNCPAMTAGRCESIVMPIHGHSYPSVLDGVRVGRVVGREFGWEGVGVNDGEVLHGSG